MEDCLNVVQLVVSRTGCCTSDSLFVHLCKANPLFLSPCVCVSVSIPHIRTNTLYVTHNKPIFITLLNNLKEMSFSIYCANTWPAGCYYFVWSSRGMPFNWGLGGDVASIGLPRSKASPPMLISQGQEEPVQCFSFEGGRENTITGTLL